MRKTKGSLQGEIFAFQKELLVKSLDISDRIIDRLDEQALRTRHWCILVWLGFVGWSFTANMNFMFFVALIVPILFWLANASIKRLQRGYVITSNFIQKRLSDCAYLEEMFRKKSMLEIPAYNMNGWYTLRSNDKHREWYKKNTLFLKSFLLETTAYFYYLIIVVNILLIVCRLTMW